MRRLLLLLAALAAAIHETIALEGYLKWEFNSTDAYYPFNSPYAPAIVRGPMAGDERVVTLSKEADKWQVSALNINSGAPVWTAVFADGGGISPLGITTGDVTLHLQNAFNLAIVMMGNQLVALDGISGAVAWQWAVPVNASLSELSAWGGTLALLLTVPPPFNPAAQPPLTPPSIIIGLNASSGAPVWQANTTTLLPRTQAEASQYAVESLIVADNCTVFARGNKMAGLDSASGTVLWKTQLVVDGSIGTGQAANVTGVAFVPPPPGGDGGPLPRLLITANNWGFLRFGLLTINTTNITAPPAMVWRTKIPETALDNPSLIPPSVDPVADMFYHWSNRTDWNTGAASPPSEVWLVGRSLTDGNQAWGQRYDAMGLPAVFEGRVYVACSSGLLALQGTSGSVVWQIPAPPDPTALQSYTFNVSPTFGNNTGQLVASRCMGPSAPSLCMYSGFEPPPNAAPGRGAPALVALAAAALAAAALGAL